MSELKRNLHRRGKVRLTLGKRLRLIEDVTIPERRRKRDDKKDAKYASLKILKPEIGPMVQGTVVSFETLKRRL